MALLCDSNNRQFYQIAELFHLLNSAYFINLGHAVDYLLVFQVVFLSQIIPRHPTGNSKSNLLHYSLSGQSSESTNYFMKAFQMVHISFKSGYKDPWSNFTKVYSGVKSYLMLPSVNRPLHPVQPLLNATAVFSGIKTTPKGRMQLRIMTEITAKMYWQFAHNQNATIWRNLIYMFWHHRINLGFQCVTASINCKCLLPQIQWVSELSSEESGHILG